MNDLKEIGFSMSLTELMASTATVDVDIPSVFNALESLADHMRNDYRASLDRGENVAMGMPFVMAEPKVARRYVMDDDGEVQQETIPLTIIGLRVPPEMIPQIINFKVLEQAVLDAGDGSNIKGLNVTSNTFGNAEEIVADYAKERPLGDILHDLMRNLLDAIETDITEALDD